MAASKEAYDLYADGLSAHKIAEIMGINYRTVYQIEKKAIEKIRKALNINVKDTSETAKI